MKTTENKRSPGIWIASFVAIAFGLLTRSAAIRRGRGPVRALRALVQFHCGLLNFIAGFFYILAGVCIFRQRRAGAMLAMVIASLTVIVFGSFAVHIAFDGAYERRTLIAMSVRSLVWIAIAIFARRKLMDRGNNVI